MRLGTACLWVAVVLVACDFGPTEPESGSLDVSGQARVDGRPLVGASIGAWRMYSEKVYDTSIQGYHYEIREFLLAPVTTTGPSGGYAVEARVSDCSDWAEVRIVWGGGQMKDALPSACGRYAQIDFDLVTDTIRGVVVSGGEPRAGIPVSLHEYSCGFWCEASDALISVETDASGAFELLLVACRPQQQYQVLATLAEGGESHVFEGCPPPTYLEL